MRCQWPVRSSKSLTDWDFQCGSNRLTFVIFRGFFSVGAKVQLVVNVEALLVRESPEP